MTDEGYQKCAYKSYLFLICMYKEDLALNNLQLLICHKIKPNQIYGFDQVSKSSILGEPDIAGPSRFLKPMWIFVNHLVIFFNQLCLQLEHNKDFFVSPTVLMPNLNELSIFSWFRLRYNTNCAAFKSHMMWYNAHHVIETITTKEVTRGLELLRPREMSAVS